MYSYMPKEKRHKLDSRTEQTILIGYASSVKGYRVMNLRTGEVSARHVVQRKADKRGTVLDSSNEQDQCNQPLLDILMPVSSQTKPKEVEDKDEAQDESSTPKKGIQMEQLAKL